jgi:hypothetical protein
MSKQVKIRWTDSERELVLNRAVKVMNADTVSHTEALNRAQQQVLDVSRRRNFVNAAYCSDLIKELRKRLLVIPPVSTFEIIDTPTEPQPVKSEEPILQGAVDAFVQEIAKKLAVAIKKEMVNAVVELEHSFKLAKQNIEISQPKPVTKIVIIGLRHDQESMIENEYRAIDFKFITSDEAKTISPYGRDAYAVLIMKNFISHAVYDKYRNFKNHVLVDGGMTTLRAWLSTNLNRSS